MAFAAGPRHNLPVELTSFVGRERELAEVAALLLEHRLVTLTGPGGIGKTRLVLEAVGAAADERGVGAWLVELAALTDPALVGPAVASVLKVAPRQGQPPLGWLVEELRGRELLLVLDNCEHLVAACAVLADGLLRGCPGLRLVATSREPLGVPGEAAYRVPSLSSPEAPGTPRFDDLSAYDAVGLFVERARLARSDFALTEANARPVAEICRRLDGVPLAIELAAARLRTLPIGEIAARLDDRFRLLTGGRGAPPRQQTLGAAVDWSHDLLAGTERALLRRLSVFAGGFALDAAEAVCGGEDALDGVAGLVDKSLVQLDGERYRLLEMIRQYAAEKLAEAGEADRVRAAHRDWYLAFAERAVGGMTAPDQAAWFARLEAERGNLRAALEHSRTEPNPEAELRLVGALAAFWARTRHFVEGRARIDDVVARTERVSSPAGRRARVLALDWRGFMDRRDEKGHAERAVALAREVGEGALLASALRHLALKTAPRGEARALLEEALAAAREAGVTREAGYSMAILARLSLDGGDADEAGRLSAGAVAVLRQSGDRDALQYGLRVSARVAMQRGDRARARDALEEAVAVVRELPWLPVPQDAMLLASLDQENGDFSAAAARLREMIADAADAANPAPLVFALQGAARLAAAWGDPRAAARLFGATAGHEATHSAARDAAELGTEHVADLRAALSGAAFAAAWAEGERMSLEGAAAYARALEPPRAVPAGSGPLTHREQEVARLIAEGMSNRGIAEALVVAESTAERHVANIFNKLGVHSRAQVAAWHERQRAGA